MSQQSIPCPDCQTPIAFDAKLLVLGHSFSCTNCSVTISLSPTSTPVVKDAMEKLEEIKQQAVKDSKVGQ